MAKTASRLPYDAKKFDSHFHEPSDKLMIWGGGGPLRFQNIENSNAIFNRVEDSTCLNRICTFDVLTPDDGWLRGIGIEISEIDRERLLALFEQFRAEQLRVPTELHRDIRVKELIRLSSHVNVASRYRNQVEVSKPEDEQDHPIWSQSADGVLDRLEKKSSELENAILFAETTEFTPTQSRRLLTALHRYISDNRLSKDEETITVLGSAIRKFALNMSEDHFDAYASWLVNRDAVGVCPTVELELVKAFCWRCTFDTLNVTTDSVNQIENALNDVVRSYVNPRVLVTECFASTALHAIISLLILLVKTERHDLVSQNIKWIKNVRVDWFLELVHDDLSRYARLTWDIDEHLSMELGKLQNAFSSHE